MADFKDAAKFFEANTKLLSADADQALWNLNSGLLALTNAMKDQLCFFCEADSLSSRLDSLEQRMRFLQEAIEAK